MPGFRMKGANRLRAGQYAQADGDDLSALVFAIQDLPITILLISAEN
jgi:hypothetical protein